jgi:hypothetical protein
MSETPKKINLNVNNMFKYGLYVFLALYSSLTRPNLPKFMIKLYQNNLFRMFIYFLIVYMANEWNDPGMSLLIAIAFFVTMNFITE